MGRIRELAEMYPDLATRLLALLPRVVDLLPITRDHYYHPAMVGGFSIKTVLTTINSELDHSKLVEIQDGQQAQNAYMEAIAPETSTTRIKEIELRLKNYCCRDSQAMLSTALHLANLR